MTGKHIIVGVAGSIAAYKAVLLVRQLVKEGAEVSVVMTDAAREFVAPITFSSVSGNRVWCSMFEERRDRAPRHIWLAQEADLLLIAPATANIIGKIANGIADDLLSTLHLALNKNTRLFLYPSMNEKMLFHPATIHNLKVLAYRGWDIQTPIHGKLACGDLALGKLPKPRSIVEYVYASIIGEKVEGKPMFRERNVHETFADYLNDPSHEMLLSVNKMTDNGIR